MVNVNLTDMGEEVRILEKRNIIETNLNQERMEQCGFGNPYDVSMISRTGKTKVIKLRRSTDKLSQ